VGLHSVESVAHSLADESTEVFRESLLTDFSWNIPAPMVYNVQPLESKILHQHNCQSHHCHYPPNQQTMSFTASSPACVSVTLDVVNNHSMCSVLPWNFTPQPFGLSQSPSSVVATAALSEAADDDLVVVRASTVETPVVERLFLDDKKEIEFLGQKGPINMEVESEIDKRVQPVHDPWSADKVKAARWSTAGWEPQPIELVDVHNLSV